MSEEFEPEKFVEQREPGRVIESFEYDGKESQIRYAKMEDFEGIAQIDKVRWEERSNLEEVSEDVQKKQRDRWSHLKELPEITNEKIKEIREHYRQQLKKIEEEGLEFLKKGQENLERHLEDSFSDSRKPFFLVATVEGRVVGYISIGEDYGGEDDAIRVYTISLMPDYQGKKAKTEGSEQTNLSHELLKLGIEEARNEATLKDKKKIILGTHTWTPRAVGFWEKEGFKRENRPGVEKAAVSDIGAWENEGGTVLGSGQETKDLFSIRMVKMLEGN